MQTFLENVQMKAMVDIFLNIDFQIFEDIGKSNLLYWNILFQNLTLLSILPQDSISQQYSENLHLSQNQIYHFQPQFNYHPSDHIHHLAMALKIK